MDGDVASRTGHVAVAEHDPEKLPAPDAEFDQQPDHHKISDADLGFKWVVRVIRIDDRAQPHQHFRIKSLPLPHVVSVRSA
ncbi:hypothetical protein D3C71_1730390 [compost metagenome]